MPERCYDEKIREIKDKHEHEKNIPGPTTCKKNCYIVCKVECKRETVNVKDWSFVEVKDAKPGPWVYDKEGHEIRKK